jgi:hypothetical protein
MKLSSKSANVAQPCDGGQALEFTVAIGGTADAEGRAAMVAPDANDPSPTLAVHCGSGFDVNGWHGHLSSDSHGRAGEGETLVSCNRGE